MAYQRLARALGALMIAVGLILAGVASVAAPAFAQDAEQNLLPPPGGQQNDAEIWRAVRGGVQGTVSIPDKKAGVLVQSEGDAWRALRNGPLSVYGSWLLLGTIIVLALFFAIRGRIKLDGAATGRLVMRFGGLDRLVHWVTAVSFIILALTGLNVMYGRYVLLPLMSESSFASLTMTGKYLHNYVGFVFMLGIFMMLVLWIRHNVPNGSDLTWLARGGGLLKKGVHPPARKFNAGQKIVFWAVILVGAAISYTGLTLLMPFSGGMTVQDMQSAQLLHTGASLVLMALILAHIYIGSIGMEGALDAMVSGKVDETWAHEHHSLWAESLDDEEQVPRDASPAPAE